MKDLNNLGGRPRQFPPCPRYKAHRFSPKTGRCPCGYTRTGEHQAEPTRRVKMVTVGVKMTEAMRDELHSTAGRKAGEVIREMVQRWLEEKRMEAF